MDTIIRAPRGTDRRKVKINSIVIPNLWNIAQAISVSHPTRILNAQGAADHILECWHLCHDLLENIRADNEGRTP